MDILLKTPRKEIKEKMKNLTTLEDVADLLEIKSSVLLYYIVKKSSAENYKKFTIPKKSGGERIIYSPITNLKIIQKKLNYAITQVYYPKNYVFGFCKGKGIKENASFHLKNKHVLNLDLENFFTSIHYGRVKGLFMGRKFNFNPEVAQLLAKICCYRINRNKSFLPSGAPTSPIISNMICYQLDYELSSLAKSGKNRCIYSRYADDLTFSSVVREAFPENIIKKRIDYYDKHINLSEELQNIIKNNGFNINHNKVRIRSKCDRQEVTGIVINKKVNINRIFIRQVRAMLHDWEKNTYEKAEKKHFDNHKKQRLLHDPLFSQIVYGKINFIRMIRGEKDYIYRRFLNKYNKLMENGRLKLPEDDDQEIYQALWLIKNDKTTIGTGFMLKDYGLVTCNHVIEEIEKRGGNIKVAQHEDSGYNFNVEINEQERSKELDLAILKILSKDKFHEIEISDKEMKQKNEYTIFGFPGYSTGNDPSMTDGKISGYTTTTPRRYTFDKPLFAGNSGGPAIDGENKVVGIAAFGIGSGHGDLERTTDFGVLPISSIKTLKPSQDPAVNTSKIK